MNKQTAKQREARAWDRASRALRAVGTERADAMADECDECAALLRVTAHPDVERNTPDAVREARVAAVRLTDDELRAAISAVRRALRAVIDVPSMRDSRAALLARYEVLTAEATRRRGR